MPKIVVTGATQGIGKAIVEKFASNGYDVAICARSVQNVKDFSAKLREDNKQIDVIAEKCDVSIKKEVEKFADVIIERWGEVDVLVNNAGVFSPGQIHLEEEGVLENLINTNLYSAYYLTRKILPLMKAKEKGHIFNICSTASIVAYPNGGSYCISKHALYGMSRVLREEMKPFKIKVTSVLPGATFTDSWAGAGIPEERFMPAEDVAEAIFSCSRLSSRTNVEEILLRPGEGDI